MSNARLVFALALLPSAGLAQAAPERGGFVVRLGTDTLSVERFTRTATRLEGEIASRVPQARYARYVATLNPDATVARIEIRGEPADPAGEEPRLTAEVVFGPDSARTTATWNDSTQTFTLKMGPGAMPYIPFSYALEEQYVRRLRRSGQDSLGIQTLQPGGRQAVGISIARRGADAADLDFLAVPGFYPGGQPSRARIDREGRILALDGSNSTFKVAVERVRGVDVEKFRKAFAALDAAGRSMGQLSPTDTLHAAVGGAHLTIAYGRPRKRGREIFGGVVPWDRVWRTGANAATQFETDADLIVQGTTIPKGRYTLFSIPARSGSKLIVNRQTGQWGTAYDATQDLARLDLATESVAEPVETFTIAVEPAGAGGVLRFRWDRTQFSLPFTVRQ
ncbi:MAG TPA: DUF2911 domain-containing protein [Gemmatimonadales bacterium]|nr:DUF2911 domain-containing protein [Gemmatimonadales bacterium]